MSTTRIFTPEVFWRIVERLRADGYADGDIEWSENVGPPPSALEFAQETIWVICNSGMKNTVARLIYDRIMAAFGAGLPASAGFGHPGKAAAIQRIWDERDAYFAAYMAAEDKLAYCASIPWIGQITKFHLAKNFGFDVAKPDVHLERLAKHEGTDPHHLCAQLAAETGYRAATVDLILWRACATGVVNSVTGEIRLQAAVMPAVGQ